jgi:hypothetical protein
MVYSQPLSGFSLRLLRALTNMQETLPLEEEKMKRKTSLVILGMVLSVLIGASLVSMQPAYAYMSDCEMDRFNAFMNANDQYTSTFRSWYFGEPESCTTQCSPQCQGLTGSAWTTCMNDCISSCDSSRYNSFTSAQDSMIAAANQTCSYNPDFCAQARALRDQCVMNFNSQMENPVLDENGEVDVIWGDAVITEYMSCRTASGVDSCE